MINKFFTASRPASVDLEGTGTFADGAFALTLSEQREFDRQYSLRTSYGRDHVLARNAEQHAPSFG